MSAKTPARLKALRGSLQLCFQGEEAKSLLVGTVQLGQKSKVRLLGTCQDTTAPGAVFSRDRRFNLDSGVRDAV